MNAEQARVAELTGYVYDQVLAGRRDVLDRVLAEDFVAGGTVEVASREDWLTLMLDQTTWDSIDITEVCTAMNVEDAVVVAALVQPNGMRDGEPLTGTFHVIDVWHRTGVDWRLLTRTTFAAS